MLSASRDLKNTKCLSGSSDISRRTAKLMLYFRATRSKSLMLSLPTGMFSSFAPLFASCRMDCLPSLADDFGACKNDCIARASVLLVNVPPRMIRQQFFSLIWSWSVISSPQTPFRYIRLVGGYSLQSVCVSSSPQMQAFAGTPIPYHASNSYKNARPFCVQ